MTMVTECVWCHFMLSLFLFYLTYLILKKIKVVLCDRHAVFMSLSTAAPPSPQTSECLNESL
jgi:hypothetical protein